jgi:hypothetical protein
MEQSFDFSDLNKTQFKNLIELMTAFKNKKFSEKFSKNFDLGYKAYIFRVNKVTEDAFIEDYKERCGMLMNDGLIHAFDTNGSLIR